MKETDYADFAPKTESDRTVMHVLYGLHTVAPFSYWTLALVAVVVNYIKRGDEADLLYVAHHDYMLRTFWWTVLWLVLTSPLYLLFFLPGFLAHSVVGLWYLYRCIRGWLRFVDHRPPQ